ncbi:MAG: DUF1028 domain-containing protein [Actinomycetota bacterium]|nr:DUF1028 domain-containing protein [Rubrobacter sp.]MDQ3508275.1 DUF1028 domain-containing protein [Actinomycetota bacterium]
MKVVSTFSIAALDPDTESLGIAVQSKFLAVGAVVPWAKAGVGAVATQAMANVNYGPRGLELMANGASAEETVEALTRDDADREHRQIGVVDASGGAATFTGGECFGWAGGGVGENFVAQGNILVGRETVEAMAEAFETATGDFARRLLAALDAGQKAGGDARGRQSAALLVVREGGGYGGDNDREIDLRVDDHPEPIHELLRLRNLHELYFGDTREEVAIEGEVREEVASHLIRLGHLEEGVTDEAALFDALEGYVRIKNFEERERGRGYVDRAVLRFMSEENRG